MRHLKVVIPILILLALLGLATKAVFQSKESLTDSAEIEQTQTRETDQPAENDEAEAVLADGVVTLYEVDAINSRTQDLTATTLSAASDGISAANLSVSLDDDSLSYQQTQLGDIPMLAVWQDDGEAKPLLIFLHGVCCDKESVLPALEAYAEAGYYAVSFDAYDQGSRFSEDVSCDDWAAMLITVNDVNTVVEYYAGVSGVETENFVLGGFSMGAIETWVYAEIGSYEPSALITMCGVCEYSAWQPWVRSMLNVCWIEGNTDGDAATTTQFQEMSYTQDKIAAITSLNITDNLDSFADIPIFSCVGTWDWFFDDAAGSSALSAIQAAGNDNVTYTVYDRTTHQITEDMIADSVAFLESLPDTASTAETDGIVFGMLSAVPAHG